MIAISLVIMKKFKNERGMKKKRFSMFFYKIYDNYSIAIPVDLTKVIPDKL